VFEAILLNIAFGFFQRHKFPPFRRSKWYQQLGPAIEECKFSPLASPQETQEPTRYKKVEKTWVEPKQYDVASIVDDKAI
jgi:hypothetical protein